MATTWIILQGIITWILRFDPPYYIKKEKAHREKATEETPSISSYSKESYEKFIESFLILAP